MRGPKVKRESPSPGHATLDEQDVRVQEVHHCLGTRPRNTTVAEAGTDTMTAAEKIEVAVIGIIVGGTLVHLHLLQGLFHQNMPQIRVVTGAV